MRPRLLQVLLSTAALLSPASAASGYPSKYQEAQTYAAGNMLGIRLPDGFEPTRRTSDSVHLLQTQCAAMHEGFGVGHAYGAPSELREGYDFASVPGTLDELIEAVMARLVEAGYKVRYVFEQFLDEYGIVIAIVFGPTGEEAFYLLFDLESRLFHPVGPCPVPHGT